MMLRMYVACVLFCSSALLVDPVKSVEITKDDRDLIDPSSGPQRFKPFEKKLTTSINSCNFKDVVNDQQAGPAFIMFTNKACKACRQLHKIWNEFSAEHGDQATFGWVDCSSKDGSPDLCKELNVYNSPTFLAFPNKSGQEVREFSAEVRDKETLHKWSIGGGWKTSPNHREAKQGAPFTGGVK